MKIICIHHRLTGMNGHRYNEALGLLQEAKRGQFELQLLISTHANQTIAAELNARAVLDDPTFRSEWSFEERTRRFVAMLHDQVAPGLNADDCVLITVATQLESNALARWMRELPPGQRPWIVILMISDRWNRGGHEEHEKQLAEFGILKAELAKLPPVDARKVIFGSLTPALADELSELLGLPVAVAPIPMPDMDETGIGNPYPAGSGLSRRPRVAVLGGTRREKGSHLVRDIVVACQQRVAVDFVVHLSNETLTAEEFQMLSGVASEPGVEVLCNFMSLKEYTAILQTADIALFPYEIIPYRQRTSGVFVEAAACGKPAVATRGTWMAQQLEEGRAAGVIFDELAPDCIADAIKRCVTDLGRLRGLAQARSDRWRNGQCTSAFVRFMEDQIASRKASGSHFSERRINSAISG